MVSGKEIVSEVRSSELEMGLSTSDDPVEAEEDIAASGPSLFRQMMTKFNQEMYARMKAKKNDPLSSLRKKVVWIIEKGTPITPATSILEATRTASPTTSLEKLTSRPKRQRTLAKRKEKALGEAIHISAEYLSQEEKAVMVGSKVEALEVEAAKLRRDLITAMDDANTAGEKVKVLADELRVETQLMLRKDEQLQAANQKVKSVATMAV
ncbi:hypothetical protein SO802_001130 [Lithocarpus litseifolius]|uniref:Uncharacterized protein n=1 Tax=Lithocarpus litseifolius TaxID=425828 RepID=A0AAW2DZ71_9ROSI